MGGKMTCPECGRTDVDLETCSGCGEEMCTYCVEDCRACWEGDEWGVEEQDDEE